MLFSKPLFLISKSLLCINMFLKYQVVLRSLDKTSLSIFDFHDKWDVKNNYTALQQRPGIGYHNSRRNQIVTGLHPSQQKPTGLEWTCMGKIRPTDANIHASKDLQQLIQSKTIEWEETNDWTDLCINISPDQWENMAIHTLLHYPPPPTRTAL
jgi:hypothetical protein